MKPINPSLLDDVISQFFGSNNHCFYVDEVYGPPFKIRSQFQEIDGEIHDAINFLISEGVIKESDNGKKFELSSIGRFIARRFSTHGYIALRDHEKKEKWKRKIEFHLIFWPALIGALLAAVSIARDVVKESKPIDIRITQDPIVIRDTVYLIQTSQLDTTTQQMKLPLSKSVKMQNKN